MTDSATQLVKVDGVNFSYGERPVLRDAHLDLHSGCFCVLRGANGAGKSTLLSLILGEQSPSSGIIEVLGANPAKRSSRKLLAGRVGVVPQRVPTDYRRFPLTVLELVLTGLYSESKWYAPQKKEHYERSRALIAELGLIEKEGALLSELSGGQLQRALLARAMVSKPELLILDEPTSSLDQKNVEVLVEALQFARDSMGAGCLFVTHDLARLPELYDRVIELNDGQLRDVMHEHIKDPCHCGEIPSKEAHHTC